MSNFYATGGRAYWSNYNQGYTLTALSAQSQLHEFGHAFGRLADEYVKWQSSGACTSLAEANVDCVRKVDDAKWSHWAGAFGGAVPPSGGDNFEGAKYYAYGRFRPMYSTVMRRITHPTHDYGPVNREAIVKKIFEWIPLITVSPAPGEVSAPAGCGDLVFRPSFPADRTLGERDLHLAYTLDGVEERLASDGSLTLSRPCAWATGDYALRLDAELASDYVKSDPSDLLSQSFAWTVKVVNKPPAAVGEPPDWSGPETDGALALDASGWFSDPEDNDLAYSWSASPAGIVAISAGPEGAASMTTAGPGTAAVTVTASDAASGGSAVQSFDVTVVPGALAPATAGFNAGRYWPVCEGGSRAFVVANPHSAKTVQVSTGSSVGAPGYTPPAPLDDDADLAVSPGPSVAFPAGGAVSFTATAAPDADSVNGTRKFSFAHGGTEIAVVYLREIDQGSPFWAQVCAP